jgi:glutaredoxin
MMKNIMVYSRHGGMFCDQAKEYLSQNGIKFRERDIAQHPGALADLKKLGYMTTPVIVVDGSVIVGFDAEKIDRAVQG